MKRKYSAELADKMMSALEVLVEDDYFSDQSKNILDAIFFMHQMLLHAYSTDYKTFKNAWNNYNMFVQSISEDKFLELQNRASEIMKSFGYIEKKGDKV